jgi:ubiquinone/menaquinone biosynthesis C-methylase UbiE
MDKQHLPPATTGINLQAQESARQNWNAFSQAYDAFMHLYLLQGFNTLAIQCKVSEKSRVLEVACGSGLHSLYLAKGGLLKKGAVMVCTDISDGMVNILKDKFERGEYLDVPGNRLEIITESLLQSGFDLETKLKQINFNDASERFVLAALANNECLPFKEGTFDCYLGNLSLMLVDNYLSMLSEALRVTQSGASFGFTIYGREGFFQNYEMLVDVLIRHELMPRPNKEDPPKKTIYDLSREPTKLKTEMEALGFTQIRMWYQPMNFNFKDADEYCACYCETVTARNLLSKVSIEKAEAFKADLKQEFTKRMGG